MTIEKILAALSPCMRAKIAKMSEAFGCTPFEAVVLCLEGETTKRVSAPER